MSEETTAVIITDVRMKFWSMVWFMVKWAIASIPALIILGAIVMLATAVFGAMFWGVMPNPYRI